MTVYKLVAAVKVHLCDLSKSVQAVLAGQSNDRLFIAEQLGDINTRLAALEASAARIEAALARIESAVIEDDNAAGIRLTVTAQ